MKNLTFAWPRCKPLFNQFNLQIERHQKTYIAGASGSGKSTLLNLLAGVLDTGQGEIWFNNHAFHQRENKSLPYCLKHAANGGFY